MENKNELLQSVLFAILIMLTLTFCCIITEVVLDDDTNNYYSELFIVDSIDKEQDVVVFKNVNGYLFTYDGIGDICENEYYTATMNNNGTADIKDDIIVNIRYTRLDLFQ